MLTCWHSHNEGFGVRPHSSPVWGPDFEKIAFAGLQTIHEGRSCLSRIGEGLGSKWLESRGVWKNVFWNDLADGWKEETENSPVSSRQTVWAGWIRTCITKMSTLAMHAKSEAGAQRHRRRRTGIHAGLPNGATGLTSWQSSILSRSNMEPKRSVFIQLTKEIYTVFGVFLCYVYVLIYCDRINVSQIEETVEK